MFINQKFGGKFHIVDTHETFHALETDASNQPSKFGGTLPFLVSQCASIAQAGSLC